MASIASGKKFIIPKLKKNCVTSVKNLERDVVLQFPKARPLLPNRAELEKKRLVWEENKKENHLQIVRTAVLKQKSNEYRQRTLDYAHSKIKEESAIRKRSIEDQVTFYHQQRTLKLRYKKNQAIADVKQKLMAEFQLGHLISFHTKEGIRIRSSHILQKSEDIYIRQQKINYHHHTNNKYYILLKTKGSDKKLIQYFKHAMKKTFSINEKNIINTKIIRLKLKRSQILFEIEKDNNFCEIEFKQNYLFMQNKRIKIKPFVNDV